MFRVQNKAVLQTTIRV